MFSMAVRTALFIAGLSSAAGLLTLMAHAIRKREKDEETENSWSIIDGEFIDFQEEAI